MQKDIPAGTRIVLPTGRKGAIAQKTADMPLHYLVVLDDGRMLHFLKSICKVC